MQRLTSLFFVVLFFICSSTHIIYNHVNSSVSYSDEDMMIFHRYLQAMKNNKNIPFHELIIETALFFKDTPYIAYTLESEEEHLIINLRELDCTTFVENVVALANTVKDESPSFDLFCNYLKQIRYRNGNITRYTDRLHYFSDWIYENEEAGFVKDMTGEIGGRPYALNLSFMSSHPESYPALKKYPEFIEIIEEKEQEISARDVYTMIPEADIKDLSGEMKDGDIVCFVTKIDGLDVTHVGFVYWNDNRLGFLHASSGAKKVVVDPRSLLQYIQDSKSTIGAMIVRPQNALL